MQISKEFQQQEHVRISSRFPLLSNSNSKLSTVVGSLMLVFCQTCCLIAFCLLKGEESGSVCNVSHVQISSQFICLWVVILSKDHVWRISNKDLTAEMHRLGWTAVSWGIQDVSWSLSRGRVWLCFYEVKFISPFPLCNILKSRKFFQITSEVSLSSVPVHDGPAHLHCSELG